MKLKNLKESAVVCAVLFAFASCSNDAVIEQVSNEPTNALISYSVNVPAAGRAATVYSSTVIPSQFYVWSTFTPSGDNPQTQAYFNCDLVSTNTDEANKGIGTHYWPTDAGTLNFYALGGFDPDNNNWAWGDDFVPSYTYSNATSDVDLLYAVTTDKKRIADPTNEYVNINFRHAMAQIAFKFEVQNPNMYVEVSAIEVRNTYQDGTFKFPAESTTTQYLAGDKESFNTGEWSFPDTKTYKTDTVEVDKELTYYNPENTTAKLGAVSCNDILLLTPASYQAWEGAKEIGETDTYFAIKCKIYNSLDGLNKNVLIWDNTNSKNETQYVLVPANFDWTMGRRYTYTFIFGNGNGGYDSNTPENQVLFPIQYIWSCDDWVEVDPQGVNVNPTSEE